MRAPTEIIGVTVVALIVATCVNGLAKGDWSPSDEAFLGGVLAWTLIQLADIRNRIQSLNTEKGAQMMTRSGATSPLATRHSPLATRHLTT